MSLEEDCICDEWYSLEYYGAPRVGRYDQTPPRPSFFQRRASWPLTGYANIALQTATTIGRKVVSWSPSEVFEELDPNPLLDHLWKPEDSKKKYGPMIAAIYHAATALR